MTRVKAMAWTADWRKVALGALLLTVGYLLMAPDAFAAVNPEEAAGRCKNFPGLTNKIAACIRLTLLDISTIFFEEFYELIRTAIGAFITLVIAVYGVMTAMGMLEKPGRDTMVLALKLSLVGYFTMNVDMIYRWDMDMMDAAGAAVVSFVPQSGPLETNVDYDQIQCLKLMQDEADTNPQAGNPVVGPWLAIDCVIDTVIGLKREDADAVEAGGVKKWYNENLEGEGLSRGLVRFFFSSFQDSSIGILIAVIGFIFLYSLVFLIIKSLFTYLGGYIAITFLMIFAPLFIPLVLFRTTKEYFDKWVKLVLGMTLQPIFILLFVTMSIVAMDLAVFSGDYSVMYKVAGEASRKKGFNLNKYLDDHEVVRNRPTVVTEVKAEQDSQQCAPLVRDPNAGDNPLMQVYVNPELAKGKGGEGCQDYPVRFWRDSIDWEKLASVRNPGVTPEGEGTTPAQQISREVLSSIIFAGLVVFIMKGLLAIVPAIANDMVGDFGVTPNLYGQMGQIPGQANMGSMARDAAGRMGTMVSQRLRPGGGG